MQKHDLDHIKDCIKANISCRDLLEPSKSGLYCCPVCNSGHGPHKTGAVKYYPESNTWYCHACNAGGDVIDLYGRIHGSEFNEAITELSARAGIRLPETAAEQKNAPQTRKKKESDKHIAEDKKTAKIKSQAGTDYSAYYNHCAGRLSGDAALSYLQARGISMETAALFNIGYDPEADPATAPGAISDSRKKYPEPRLIIPCTKDFYIARAVQPDCSPQYKAPNPKGSQTALFNEQALETERAVFVVEGVFDALAVIECGEPAVALNGSGNGKLLLQALKNEQNRPAFIICPDNDEEPRTAARTQKQAEALCSDLQAAGYKAVIYNIAGSCKDAGDALTADRPRLEEAVKAALEEVNRDDLTVFLETITSTAYKPNRTGLDFFDDLTGGGIVNQSLMLLAAAPGTGKTTLAQQVAESIAHEERPVLFLNFEMAREQLLAKAISARLHKSGYHKTAMQVLQGYRWTPQDRKWIEEAIRDYRAEQYPFIRYNPTGTSADLDSLKKFLNGEGDAARAEGRRAPAAVIDYLHLITSKERIETAELLKRAIIALKTYAIEYNTFVVAVCATNRESSKSGKLGMESVRDSSNLEYTADYHVTLNYTELDKGKGSTTRADIEERLAQAGGTAPRDMTLRVVKNRFGIPGKTAEVYFKAAYNLFYGKAEEPETLPEQVRVF